MHYKKLLLSDFNAFSTLRDKGLEKFPEAFSSSKEEELPKRKSRFESTAGHAINFMLGAFDGDALCGQVGFMKEDQIKLKHRGFIWGMIVDPDYQKKGIGLELMQRALDFAFENKEVLQIYLGVGAYNTSAINLYKKVGFEQYGYEKNAMIVDGEYVDEILMVKFRDV